MDIGGGASAERVSAALKIILLDPSVNVVLINIFGGITRCNEVANGIMHVLNERQVHIPIVVRLAGTNSDEGKNILNHPVLKQAESINEAAKICIDLAGKAA
jgi:succinyl-CoA synthetase beta subunit